jgi:hypothetical protein
MSSSNQLTHRAVDKKCVEFNVKDCKSRGYPKSKPQTVNHAYFSQFAVNKIAAHWQQLRQIIWMKQQADRLDPMLPSPPSILDRKGELKSMVSRL